MFLDFRSFALWLNLAIFAAAAVAVWIAGTKLSRRADKIADRTGLGKAFIGLVLLAGATSLPEVATTTTGTLTGNVSLAVNNLIGVVATQMAVMSVADGIVGGSALTSRVPRPVLLLEGAALVMLLAILQAGFAAGPILSIWGIGIWTLLIAATYLLSLYLIRGYEGSGRWEPVEPPEDHEDEYKPNERAAQERSGDHFERRSTGRLFAEFAGFALVILVAGYLLARTADALALQTGLGSSFVGATLLAISTSLPEISTTIAAVRIGAYSMAVSNIFGSSSFTVTLIFLVDVLHREGPILPSLERTSTFAAAIGSIMTVIYLIGLIERRDKVIWRLGVDSAAVLVIYLGSVGVLYTLR